jgi:hypothetical protein
MPVSCNATAAQDLSPYGSQETIGEPVEPRSGTASAQPDRKAGRGQAGLGLLVGFCSWHVDFPEVAALLEEAEGDVLALTRSRPNTDPS